MGAHGGIPPQRRRDSWKQGVKLSSSAVLDPVRYYDDALARARRVVELEAQTLFELSASLGNTFIRACEILNSASGRIVVAGVGKSGHVARKVAATLSATGSPAIYVHPGEAAHGDLGMVVPGDVVLLISNSGNTSELRVLFDHARKFSIPTVGITAVRGSMVARRSDTCIVVPKAQEACPVNIAPTSSTTQQLALGDAIAMVLMDMREISKEEIKRLHPGGMIGLRLSTVEELMHREESLPLVPLDMAMDAVVSKMTSMGFGIAGVTDADGLLVGIITDGDLRRHFQLLNTVRARDVMTAHPKVLKASMAAEDALRFLNTSKVTCAFVVADGEPVCPALGGGGGIATGCHKPVGIIHLHDFLRLGLS